MTSLVLQNDFLKKKRHNNEYIIPLWTHTRVNSYCMDGVIQASWRRIWLADHEGLAVHGGSNVTSDRGHDYLVPECVPQRSGHGYRHAKESFIIN